jgi:hypothetical protein
VKGLVLLFVNSKQIFFRLVLTCVGTTRVRIFKTAATNATSKLAVFLKVRIGYTAATKAFIFSPNAKQHSCTMQQHWALPLHPATQF